MKTQIIKNKFLIFDILFLLNMYIVHNIMYQSFVKDLLNIILNLKILTLVENANKN